MFHITNENEVKIPVTGCLLTGNLEMPGNMPGMVIFSHGSGSSRNSPRNQMVARALRKRGMGTLLFDLLTEEEDQVCDNRFNIELLAGRLIEVTQWLERETGIKACQTGYFGASTGAASALIAAAENTDIAAVVSRGGRPDLALPVLDKVKSPTLLIVGGYDEEVIQLNKEALERIGGIKKLVVVPGATHLFEEEGKMEAVAQLAGDWFADYLGSNC